MDASRLGVVRWQLRLAWSLAELQLPQLTDEARVLDATDEAAADRPFGYPWPEPRPFVLAAAWAAQELMKNVAEIGAAGVRLHAAAVHREVS